MAVTRKPKPAPAANEQLAQELIRKGGSVAATGAQPAEPELVSVLLRLPRDMLARIDASVKRRQPVRIPRMSWIIETLQERLEREEG
jgi:hypothetical protein